MSEEMTISDQQALAENMLERARLHGRIQKVDQAITELVLKQGSTAMIAGVEAKYFKPSDVYDYKQAVDEQPGGAFVDGGAKFAAIELHTTKTESESTAWKKVCETLEILDSLLPTETKPARVAITVKGL